MNAGNSKEIKKAFKKDRCKINIVLNHATYFFMFKAQSFKSVHIRSFSGLYFLPLLKNKFTDITNTKNINN